MKAKKILITLIVALVMCSMSVSVLALPVEVTPDTENVSEDVTTFGNTILGVLQAVGTIAAVGILMVLGIKYMMGSTEEKAEYKKTMLPYVIGAVMLFAAVNVAAVIANMAGGLSDI